MKSMKPKNAARKAKAKATKPAKPAKSTKSTKPKKQKAPSATLSMTSPASAIRINPSALKLAPELAIVPMMGAVADHYLNNPKAADLRKELDAERQGTHHSLDEIGIIEPLKVTLSADGTHGKVWDGRHRLEWALARGKDTVPVMHVEEEVGRKLMEASVIGRRHWTKGQRAYLGVICHPSLCLASRQTRSDSVGSEILTHTSLADHIGVSPDIVGQAVQLYRAFHAPGSKAGSAEAIEAAECKAKYEMSIWAGAGLGAVLAGIGGGKATHGKDRKASDWAALDKPLGTMTRLSHLWDKWPDEDRSKALRLMSTRFKEEFSPTFRLALSEALAAADDALS